MYEFENGLHAAWCELNRKFLRNKNLNASLIASYNRQGFLERADRVAECGTYVDFRIPADGSEPPRLNHANFCKDRLCVMCSWRRSLKVFGQVSQIMDVLEKDYQFVFVTLTVRNCSASELSATVDDLQKSFYRLCHLKRFAEAFEGYFKALEITRNTDGLRQFEFHPHFHVIFAVKPDYFASGNYVTFDELRDAWRRVCRLDYDPQVRIQKCRPKDGEGDVSLGSVIAEIAKYSVKSADYLTGDYSAIDRAVRSLVVALGGRRLCSFGGVFNDVADELDLDDVTDGDLVNTDNTPLRPDVLYMLVQFKWQVGFGYELDFIGELKDEVKNEYQ